MAKAKAKPKLTTSVQVPMSEVEEAMTDEELDMRITANKPKGRPRDEQRLSFQEAKEFIITQQISSVAQYAKWWDREQPKTIPRYPYRVYKEWTTWNDFLGNENKFNEKIGTKWKPLLDVIPYIHSLKLSSQSEWLEYHNVNKEDPKLSEIPVRPDLVYDNWRSWGHFLGNKPVAAIEARQEAQRVQIYSIVHYSNDPGNVLVYAIDPNPSTFKERYEDQQFTIVKTYWYNSAYAQRISEIVNAFSSPWMDATRQRVTPNVYDILWHLDQILDPVLRGQV